MAAEQKKKKKSGGENVKIFARVRQLMPWEPRKVSLKVKGNKIRNQTAKATTEYAFSKVFNVDVENDQIFKATVEPMISNVLNGFNAILIAYGQTGSGKTYSMLGKPKINVVGLLPMMLITLVDTPTVHKVELSAVEAFGHHVARIELYDLFDPINQNPNWTLKKGSTTLEPLKAKRVPIKSIDDAYNQIEYAHAASHFAPTGKNPESSRGHVVFCAKVVQDHPTIEHAEQTSYFIMVDCAGSEGESAFSKEFVASIDKTTLMARRLEAGCINTGLSQLQVVFNELRYKGALSKMVGNGLRRILHPYINTRTFLCVLFTFSPSVNNSKPTESTLKFAVTAGMVKVKPVRAEAVVNVEKLVEQLRKHIAENDKLLDSQNDKLSDLQTDWAKMQQDMLEDGNVPVTFVGDDNKDAENGGGEPKGRESVLPTALMDQLKELDAEEDDEDDVLDDMFMPSKEDSLAAKKVQQEMEAALKRMEAAANGADMVKSALGDGAISAEMVANAADSGGDDEKGTGATDDHDDTDTEYEEEAFAMDLDKFDKSKLMQHCDDQWIKIEENRIEQQNLKKSQQTVVSHLVETNEWLFNALNDILNSAE